MMLHKKVLMFMATSIFSLNVMAVADIYVYPNRGQTPQQQSQDRYECHAWAVNQSGFDPSRLYTASPAPVLVASTPAGHYPYHRDLDPLTGAAGGAALGALGGAIGGDAGKGAAIGAGVGALAGIFSSAGNHQRNRQRNAQIRAQQAARQSQQLTDLEQDRANYKRALGACLEAHDYTVK